MLQICTEVADEIMKEDTWKYLQYKHLCVYINDAYHFLYLRDLLCDVWNQKVFSAKGEKHHPLFSHITRHWIDETNTISTMSLILQRKSTSNMWAKLVVGRESWIVWYFLLCGQRYNYRLVEVVRIIKYAMYWDHRGRLAHCIYTLISVLLS